MAAVGKEERRGRQTCILLKQKCCASLAAWSNILSAQATENPDLERVLTWTSSISSELLPRIWNKLSTPGSGAEHGSELQIPTGTRTGTCRFTGAGLETA